MIYVGNVYEWTMEFYADCGRFYRGGSYDAEGNNSPVSIRFDDPPDYDYDYVGFRLALYIK